MDPRQVRDLIDATVNGDVEHDPETERQSGFTAKRCRCPTRPDSSRMIASNFQDHQAPSKRTSYRTEAMKRSLSKLNPKRCCKLITDIKRNLNRYDESFDSWSDYDDSASRFSDVSPDSTGIPKRRSIKRMSVGTFDLFKYATTRERIAVGFGLMLMLYAASWQPISVFILATMASLMGQYTQNIAWLSQATCQANFSRLVHSTNSPHLSNEQPNSTSSIDQPIVSVSAAFFDKIQASDTQKNSTSMPSEHQGFSLPILRPIYSILEPLFFGAEARADDDSLNSAIKDIFQLETRRFLRSSFSINGSAFLLAQTQLLSFFIGITLIAWVARQQASRIKILFFSSCLRQELTWFESIDNAAGSGSSLNVLVGKYEDGIGIKLALLSYFIGHIVLFALVAIYNLASLALFCLPFVLIVWLIIVYLSDLQSVAIGEHSMFAKRSLQLAEEIIQTIRTVFAFNGQHKELTRFNLSQRPVYKKSLIKHLYTAMNTSLSKFSIFACFAAYCFYARRLFPPFDPVGPSNRSAVLAVMRGAEVSIVNILISIPFMEALQQSKGCIARIYQIIERKSRIDPSVSIEDDNSADLVWDGSVSFRQVQFSYARRPQIAVFSRQSSEAGRSKSHSQSINSGEHEVSKMSKNSSFDESDFYEGGGVGVPRIARSLSDADRQTLLGIQELVLNNLTLEIRAGQSVALVGPSGSGKSTIISLVQRLYDITGGQLMLGQRDIRTLRPSWFRNQIGVVTQEPRLFDLSISENIRLGLSQVQLGRWSEEEIDQQVFEAARLSGAHDFISQLPQAYQTRVGSGGVQLSGGQKQRIAIARALIRRPKLLLLDECTSALDSESEAQVTAALKKASAGRTTLTVAHRLSTIQEADLIVVMDHGRVIESGTHTKLMSSNGLYKRLYEEQSSQTNDIESSDSSQSDDLSYVESSGDCENTDLKIPSRRSDTKESSKDLVGPKASIFSISSPLYQIDGTALDLHHLKHKASGIQLWRFIELPKWASLAAVLACLCAGLILPLNLIAHSYLFAAFAFQTAEELGDFIHLFGVIILSFSALVFIISFLQIILPGYVGEKISMRMRSKIIESLLKKPTFYFDIQTNGPGALCDRFNSHVSNIQSIAGSRVATLLEACSTLLVSATFGFAQSPNLSMFCLAFAIMVLFTTMIESRLMQLESNHERLYDTKVANLIADALSNIRTITSLNGERFFSKRFGDIIRERKRSSRRTLVYLRTFLTSLKFVMPAMSWSASMYYGSLLLVRGQIDLRTVFIVCPVVLFAVNDTFRALVFFPELVKAQKSVRNLYQMCEEFSVQTLQSQSFSEQLRNQGLVAGATNVGSNINGSESQGYTQKQPKFTFDRDRRLSGLASLPSYMKNQSSVLNLLAPNIGARGQIEFRGVRFAYPARPNQLILDGLSLRISPGECVALVGASGSGKSSVVAILEKFYDFHAGQVTIDGLDLRLIEAGWIRSQIGLVSQEPTLFSCSIADNIRYGDNSRMVTTAQVVEAAKAANIHDFIMSLPDQYSTQLSGIGSQLSGGQRQRVAIARALVRRAPILILDEATSALDTQNESLVREALKKSRQGRTSLVIAHRLASVKDADKIVVMREGRVVEMGTHHELMRLSSGHYRSLWRRQETRSPTLS